MKTIRSKFDSCISQLRRGWAIVAWCLLVVLASVVPFMATNLGGNVWGLFTWLSWVIFARVLWVRSGLDGVLFGSKQTDPILNDVRTSRTHLERMLTPYQMDEPLLRRLVFVGMGENEHGTRHPIYLSPDLIRKNHISFLGASGSGKTKLSTLILLQILRAGDAIVVLDPKDDEFGPATLHGEAIRLGRPVTYLNLRADSPQINPFAGTTQTQREQLLQAALQLDPSGNPSVDFHRGEDRDACASLISTGASNILDMVAIGSNMKAVTSRQNFWRELRDLARLEAFHTADSPDLLQVIQAGGLIYIVGDTDDLRIMAAQRLMLARILQIIKGRERKTARQVALMCEEFKYLLSNSALRALGTIRDRRCNLMLCYQNYSDLEDCGNLPAKAVLGAAKGNTTLKFVFKLEDATTAKEFSSIAGEHSVMVDSIGKTLDVHGMETGQWREANKTAVTVDMLTTNMPKPLAGQASVSWVFGLGPAFLLSTMHLPAGERPQITPAKPLPPLASEHLDGQAAIGHGGPKKARTNAPGDGPERLPISETQVSGKEAAVNAQELI